MQWKDWIALALLAIAIWAFWDRMKKSRRLKAMAGWTQVKGRVVSSEIAEETTADSYGESETSFQPRVTYEYEVGGKRYTGTRLAANGLSFSSRKQADRYLAEHASGTEVPVYVDLQAPGEATLTQKGSAGWWVPIFFLVLAILVEIGLFG